MCTKEIKQWELEFVHRAVERLPLQEPLVGTAVV